MQDFIRADQLDKIEHFIALGYYDSAVKESCALLEEILKKVYRQALADLPIEDRTVLLESEEKIGNRNKSYTKFGFGELVGLFNRSRLLERWGKYTQSNMGIIRSISLDYIVDLRNRLTHDQANQMCTKAEANLAYDALTNWLSFIGYKEMDRGIEKAFTSLNGEEKKQEVNIYDKVKEKVNSDYDSSSVREKRRLKLQSNYSEEFDAQCFEYVLNRMDKKQGLIGLDIGCADGYVTELRFKKEYPFDMVIGVDFNGKLIEKISQEDHGHFYYHQLDLEAKDFDDRIQAIMDEHEIEGFDVIFSALTLHHLKNPQRILMKLRKYLNRGGAIIIRGVDDGAMLAYDDGGLVEKILKETISFENVSDRFHGRKFYTMLCSLGYKDIQMRYQVDDTTHMTFEEREDFFHYYFDFRLSYTLRTLNKDPDNPLYQENHMKMQEMLDELEEKFMKPDFFFSTLTISAIGFK